MIYTRKFDIVCWLQSPLARICSLMFKIAWVVECADRKPNWLFVRILFLTRYLFSLAHTSFSMIFESIGTIDIGLHSDRLRGSPPLKIGVTLASFRHFGKTPVEKHSFISALSIGERDLAPNFKILVGILSGPINFLGEHFFKMFIISKKSVGDKKNECCGRRGI